MGRVFTMNGRKFYSIMDMAREAGVERIYVRDFEKFGIKEITGTPEADEPDNPVDVSKLIEEKPAVVKPNVIELSDVKKEVAVTKEKEEKKEKVADDKKEYTIAELVESNIETFSKYLHTISLDDLVEFCKADGVETFDEVEERRIKRMRIVVALKGKYFPGQKVPKRKPLFQGVVLGDLIKFAKDNNIEYRETGEPKTQRMWVVHALSKAGYTTIPATGGDEEIGS